MSFPTDFHTLLIGQNGFLAHHDEIIVFVYKSTLFIVDKDTLVFTGQYETHAYARASAERASIMLDVKELTPTDVRRELTNRSTDGLVTTDVSPDDI